MALAKRFVLLERERIDRSHETQLALELAHPSVRRDALRQRRALRSDGAVGLRIQFSPDRLDSGLESQIDLGFVDLGPT